MCSGNRLRRLSSVGEGGARIPRRSRTKTGCIFVSTKGLHGALTSGYPLPTPSSTSHSPPHLHRGRAFIDVPNTVIRLDPRVSGFARRARAALCWILFNFFILPKRNEDITPHVLAGSAAETHGGCRSGVLLRAPLVPTLPVFFLCHPYFPTLIYLLCLVLLLAWRCTHTAAGISTLLLRGS